MDPVQCETLVSGAAAEERTCPVCLEEIDRARVLDCGHCMCDTCATRYCRNLLGRNPTSGVIAVGPVPCPKCRDVALVALDSAAGCVGLPETGKLAALVAVCRGFVNNPSLFVGIEEDEVEVDEDGEGDSGDFDGDLEARLQSRLQAAGAELAQLAGEARDLREEIRSKVADGEAYGDNSVDDDDKNDNADNDEASSSPKDAAVDLTERLSLIFSGPADRLVRRQEAARMRMEAAWLKLRCLQFARGCYGNAFIGNFSKAWRMVAKASQEVKRAGDPACWDETALQLRRDSFVRWGALAKDARSASDGVGSDASVSAALAAAAPGRPKPAVSLGGAGNQRKAGPVQARLLWQVGRGGDGPLEFRWPVHASFVSGGRVAVCDKNNYRVQMLQASDGNFLGFMGGGCLKPRRIIQATNGNFYVCDETAACIKVFDKNMEMIGRLGESVFHCPSGIGEMKNGDLVFTDLDHAFVIVINPESGQTVRKFHTRLEDDVYIPSPHFVTLDDDDFIVVSDSLNNTVKIFDPRGRVSGRIRGFNCPRGLALDHLGNLIVVNADTHSVSLFTNLGKHLQDLLCVEDGLHFPMSAAFDKERRQLLITQCSVYGRYEVLLFQLEYADYYDNKI